GRRLPRRLAPPVPVRAGNVLTSVSHIIESSVSTSSDTAGCVFCALWRRHPDVIRCGRLGGYTEGEAARILAAGLDSSMLHWRSSATSSISGCADQALGASGSRVLRITNHMRRLNDCAHFQPEGQ